MALSWRMQRPATQKDSTISGISMQIAEIIASFCSCPELDVNKSNQASMINMPPTIEVVIIVQAERLIRAKALSESITISIMSKPAQAVCQWGDTVRLGRMLPNRITQGISATAQTPYTAPSHPNRGLPEGVFCFLVLAGTTSIVAKV